MISRRTILAGLGASVAAPAFAQHHGGHDPVYSHLTDPTIKTPPLHVAGGGAVMGGSIQSAIHEAFTLD